MASGNFFGGIATGFQRQEALTNAANYQQGLLGIEQQRLQQQQQNQQRSEFMDLRKQAIQDMQNTVTAVKNAHPQWSDAQVMNFPALVAQRDQLAGFDKNLGLDPNSAGSILAGMVAGPSQIQTKKMEATATGELPLRQAQTAKDVASTRLINQSVDNNAAVDSANPDLDTSTQLGGDQRGDNFLKSLPGVRGLNAKGLYDGTTPLSAFSTRTGKNNTKSQRQQAIEDAEVYGQLIGKPFDINTAANRKISETAQGKADSSTLTQLTQTKQGLSAFEETAKENTKVLLELAKKVPDTGSPILNRTVRAIAKDALGNKDVAAFNFQLQSVKNELARIITNPRLVGQLTDNARNEINAALDDGATVGMITQAYETALKDFQNRGAGLDKSIAEVKNRLAGKSSAVPPPPPGFNVLGQ